MGQCLNFNASNDGKKLSQKTSTDVYKYSEASEALPAKLVFSININSEILLETLQFIARRQIVNLKLVNWKFKRICGSNSLKTLHIISSVQIPGIQRTEAENQKHARGKPNKYQLPGTDELEEFVGFCNNGYPSFSVFDTPPDQYIRFAYVAQCMGSIEYKEDVYKGLIGWMLDSKVCFTNCTIAFRILCDDMTHFIVPYMEVFEHCSKIELRWAITLQEKTCPPINLFTTSNRVLHCNTIHIAHHMDPEYVCYNSLLEWLHWSGCSSRKLILFEDYGSNRVESFLQKVRQKFECSRDRHDFTIIIDSQTVQKKEAYCLFNPHVSQQLQFCMIEDEKTSRYYEYKMERRLM